MSILSVIQAYNLCNEDITVIRELEEQDLKGIVPREWISLVNEKSPEKRINIAISLWERVVGNELSLVINSLKTNLRDINLLKVGNKYYLLYVIQSPVGEEIYYIGGNPYNVHLDECGLASTVKPFYTNLHDGFYDYCFKAMGLIESNKIENLKELVDHNSHNDNLKDYLGYFSNGMGDYLAIDNNSNNAYLYFKDGESAKNVGFWDVVDEWLNMAINE